MAEYLACGLPLIINAGVGDSDKLITREGVGALVRDFTEQEYAKAAATIAQMLRNVEGTRRQTRAVARRLFDVHDVGLKGYASLYEKLGDKSERSTTVTASNPPGSIAGQHSSSR
jgi:glycosyltransferase involved in cell wall biosynthesis